MANSHDLKFKITPEVDESALGNAKKKMSFSDTKVKLDVDVSSLEASQKKIREEYNSNVKTLKELNAELRSGKTLTEEQERAYRKAKEEVKEQKKELTDIKKAISEASKSAEKFGDSFDKANQSTASLTDKFAKIGLAMSGIQQIAGTFDQFLTPFKEFDKQLKNIGTLGVKNFEDFRNAAIDLAAGVPDTVAGVTEAVYNAISAGAIEVVEGQADIAEGMKFIEQASKLAVAGLTDTNSAVKGLASVTNAYGTEFISAAQAGDILFSTVKNGVTTIPELNASLSNVVPIAAAAGVSFEEVGAAIATLTKQGVPTAQATTKIRAAIAELMKPGANLKKVMTEAGVSMETLKQEGLQVTMDKLGKAMASTGIDAANTFSSIEAISFALASTGDNAVKFAADLEAIKNDAGAVEEAFAIANQGIGVKVQGILNQIEAVAFKAFGAIGDGAVVAIDAMNKVAPTVMAFASLKDILPIDSIKNFSKTLLSKLIPSLYATATAQGVAGASATASATGFKIAGLAGIASGTATQAAWWPVVTPFVAIGAAIVGVTGALYLLYKNSEGFKNVIDKSFAVIKGLAIEVFSVIQSIGSTLYEVGKTVYSALVAPFEIAFHTVSELFNAVTDVISSALSAVFSASDTTASFSGLFDGLKAVITGIGDAFKPIQEVISKVIGYIKESISSVVAALKPFAEFLAGTMAIGLKVYYEVLKTVVGFIFNTVVGAFKAFFSVIKSIADVVKNTLVIAFEKVSGLFKSISERIKSTSEGSTQLAGVFGGLGLVIKALVSPVISLYGYFKKAGDMGTYVKGIMAGLSETFNVFKNVIAKAWDSLTSLDIKGFTSALGNLPKELASGFDKGFNAALDKEKAKKKAKEVADAVTAEAKKGNENIAQSEEKAGNAKAKAAEKAKLEVLREYEARKKNLEKANEIAELEKNNEYIRKGITKTIKDDLLAQSAKTNILKTQKDMLEEIAKQYGGAVKGGEIVGLKLDKENAKKLQEEYAKVIDDISKSAIVQDGIELKVNIEAESIAKELAKITREAKLDDLKFRLEAELITDLQYNEELTKIITDDIRDLSYELDLLNRKKIEFQYDDRMTLEITKDIGKLQDVLNKKEIDLRKSSDAILDANIRSNISAIKDSVERERKLKLYELSKTYDQQLRLAKGNKDAELKLIDDYAKKESEINEEYAKRSMSYRTQTLLNFASAFQAGLSNIAVVDNSSEVKRAKEQVKAIDDQIAKLNEAFKKGEKSYADYIKELNSLDDERVSAQRTASKQSIDIVKTLNNALSQSFGQLSETAQANINAITSSYNSKIQEVGAIQRKIATTVNLDELDSLYSALEEKNAESAEMMGMAWINFGTNVGSVFSQMLADGNSFLKSTIVAMLSGLKAMVPIFIAQIYAKEIASKSFAGIATASALTAVLTGVIAAAEAGVKSMKFAEGGEIPGGQKLITVNERGTEFVVNAKAYALNKKALAEINKRNISIDQYAREKKLVDVDKSLRLDTSRLESRLERVETSVNKVERAIHSSTYRTESRVDLEFNDKELVSRYHISRANRVRSF